jgi:hypothetical protein
MSTENNILDSKIHAPETINDPTYPGPPNAVVETRREKKGGTSQFPPEGPARPLAWLC